MSQKRNKKEQKRKQKKALAAKKSVIAAKKSNEALLSSITPDEKSALSRIMEGAKREGVKVSASDALRRLRQVRKNNDEAANLVGLKRTATESGFAKFSRENN